MVAVDNSEALLILLTMSPARYIRGRTPPPPPHTHTLITLRNNGPGHKFTLMVMMHITCIPGSEDAV